MISGRLPRPWPDLSALRLPPATSLLLAVLVFLSVVPGMLACPPRQRARPS